RGLDRPVGLGRIYRVVNEAKPCNPGPRLAAADGQALAQMLASPEGWIRDTSQRLLTEKADPASAPALKKLVGGNNEDVPKLHALWTLDAIGQLDDRTLLSALADSKPRVRAAAVRLAEKLLHSEEAYDFMERFGVMAKSDPSMKVQLQLALTLGE